MNDSHQGTTAYEEPTWHQCIRQPLQLFCDTTQGTTTCARISCNWVYTISEWYPADARLKTRMPQASLCVSLRVSQCQSLCLSVFLCVPLCVVVCLSVRVSLCVSCCVSLRVSVSLCLSVCHWVFLSRQVCALQCQVVNDIVSSAHSSKSLSALRIHHTKLIGIHSCCYENAETRKPPHQNVRMQCASIRTLRQQISMINTACPNT